MVKRRSGGENNSIGKIEARVESRVVRVGASRL